MNEKARKYIDLFRKVKIATAATVDEEGHPPVSYTHLDYKKVSGHGVMSEKEETAVAQKYIDLFKIKTPTPKRCV